MPDSFDWLIGYQGQSTGSKKKLYKQNSVKNGNSVDGEPDLGMRHVGSSPWQQISKAVKNKIKIYKILFWDFGNCIVS